MSSMYLEVVAEVLRDNLNNKEGSPSYRLGMLEGSVKRLLAEMEKQGIIKKEGEKK